MLPLSALKRQKRTLRANQVELPSSYEPRVAYPYQPEVFLPD
jgi:hypothetical protein